MSGMMCNTSNTNGNTPNVEVDTSATNGNTFNTNGGAYKSVTDRLRAAYVPDSHDDNNKKFIPRQQLEEICDKQSVKTALIAAFPQKDITFYEKLSSAICHRCRKIFAILALMNRIGLIEAFLEHPFCDNDLPLRSTAHFDVLRSDTEGLDPFSNLPDGYDSYEIFETFIDKQWHVLIPCFNAPTVANTPFNVYDLPENTILPIENTSIKQYPGGFGIVKKVKIHKEHNDFKNEYFALKILRLMTPEEIDRFFEQELEAFRKIRSDGHIIEICAAFRKGESRGFLFPWAEGGTLNHLWAKPPGDIFTTTEVKWPQFCRWICVQCHGITRDLWAIHERYDIGDNGNEDLYGIHSDIKPDNILHFSKDAQDTQDGSRLGSLKVSDLGLMKFHRLFSRTMQSKSMGHAYQTYRAPEHDMSKVRSRKIDIWAFGCLFAEFLTWAIGGKNAIEAFKTERMEEDKRSSDESEGEWSEDNFFIIKTIPITHTKVPKRKTSVDEWFSVLIKKLGPDMANTFFPRFLGFIQNSMLDPDRKRRADCKQVVAFLEKLLEKPLDSPFWHFEGTVPHPGDHSRSTTGISTW
ncbi:kinase-like domain-containing protein [Trichoderma chlorosporum]